MSPLRALCVVALVVGACGGAASPSAVAPAPTTAGAPVTPAASSSAPAYGGTGDDYGYGYGSDYGKASAAPAAPVTGSLSIVDNAKLGKLLAASNGMIVYTFKLDKPNTTTCLDQCARDWPPFALASGSPVAPAGLKGALGLLTRPDGSKQVTYNGLPLHFFAGDQKPGDTFGEGIGDVWSTVKGP